MYTRDTRRNAAFTILEGLSQSIQGRSELDSIEWKISQSVTKENATRGKYIFLKKIYFILVSCDSKTCGLNARSSFRFVKRSSFISGQERFFLHFHEISVMIVRLKIEYDKT